MWDIAITSYQIFVINNFKIDIFFSLNIENINTNDFQSHLIVLSVIFLTHFL